MSQVDFPLQLVSRSQVIGREVANATALAWFQPDINADPDSILRYNYIAAVWSLASQAIFTAHMRSRLPLQSFIDYDESDDIRSALLANGYDANGVEQVCVAKRAARGEGYA